MLQQLILSVFLVISSISLCADPINLEINLPPEFTIEPHLFSTAAFDLQTKDDGLGTIVRTFFNSSSEYNYYNTEQQLQAKAKERFFSPGVIFDVFDEKDTPVGQVEVKLHDNCSAFTLISPTGEILAQASLNFWGTCYTFTSPLLGEAVATLSRPFFGDGNTWTVNVVKQEAFNEDNIDPRLLIIAAAFHSDKRHWEAAHTPEVVYIDTHYPKRAFNNPNNTFNDPNNALNILNNTINDPNNALNILNNTFNNSNNTCGNSNGTFGVTNGTFGVTNSSFGVTNSSFGSSNGTFHNPNNTFHNPNNTFHNPNNTFGNPNNTFNNLNNTFGNPNNTFYRISCFPVADEATAITQVSELMQEELSEIEKELETHREELIEIVPSQEEFEETEVITIPYLKKMDEYIAVDEVSRFESFKEDCRSLLQLFDDSVLTLRQKKALYLMLEERLKDLKH